MIKDMSQPISARHLQQKIKNVFTASLNSDSNLTQQLSSDKGGAASKQAINRQSTNQTSPQFSRAQINTMDKLNLLEEIINNIEKFKKTKASSATLDAEKDFNAGFSSGKETIEGGPTLTEQAASIQYVEAEKSPELSPEVEKYIQEVQKDQAKAPEEIVISSEVDSMPADKQYVSERVVVLPITPEIEKKGKRKNPKLSIRWLVEWCQKIIKQFQGKVVYSQ